MKNLILTIITVCACCATQGNAQTYLADYFQVERDESLQNETFPLDIKIKEKYQDIAKFFRDDNAIKGKQDTVHTNVVTYEVLDTGVLIHVGWYIDGFIATALNGTENGKQVIVVNDSVVGISYEIKTTRDYFTHNYTWAKVTSYTNKQSIKSK
jgi:hypothetical protein